MSHVIQLAVDAGRPQIVDLNALAAACRSLGTLDLRLPAGAEIHTSRLPDGAVRTRVANADGTPADLMKYRTFRNLYPDSRDYAWGEGAVAVVAPTDEAKRAVVAANKAAERGTGDTEPFELGVLPDPANPGCYKFAYDNWEGGVGLDRLIGDFSEELGIAPKLMMHYQVECNRLAAHEQGDRFFVKQLPDGTVASVAYTADEPMPTEAEVEAAFAGAA